MSMVLQPNMEVFVYRHKKFDKRKRSTDESFAIDNIFIREPIDNTETPSINTTNFEELKDEATYTPNTINDGAIHISDSSDIDIVNVIEEEVNLPSSKRRKISHSDYDSGINMTNSSSSAVSTYLRETEKRKMYHDDDSNSVASTAETVSTVSSNTHCVTPTLLKLLHCATPLAASTPQRDDNTSTTTIPTPSTAEILQKISAETLQNICKYHGNMVRKFPKKERSSKEQDRRNKNTIACRMSRRVKKLEHIAIEDQYKHFEHKQVEIFDEALRATAYLHKLIKMVDLPRTVAETQKSSQKVEINKPTTSSLQDNDMQKPKKPYTIAFLTGSTEE